MIQTFLIFLGGGIGAAMRHGVNVYAARTFGFGFPWGTFIVNIVGSLAMGLFAAWFAFRADAGLSQHARLFLTTGLLGGFTTFSAFSLDTVLSVGARRLRHWRRPMSSGPLAFPLLALFAGLWLVRSLG